MGRICRALRCKYPREPGDPVRVASSVRGRFRRSGRLARAMSMSTWCVRVGDSRAPIDSLPDFRQASSGIRQQKKRGSLETGRSIRSLRSTPWSTLVQAAIGSERHRDPMPITSRSPRDFPNSKLDLTSQSTTQSTISASTFRLA